MVDAGGEVDLWRLERVVCGEVDREEEDAAGVGGVAGPHDGCLPMELQGMLAGILLLEGSVVVESSRSFCRFRRALQGEETYQIIADGSRRAR